MELDRSGIGLKTYLALGLGTQARFVRGGYLYVVCQPSPNPARPARPRPTRSKTPRPASSGNGSPNFNGSTSSATARAAGAWRGNWPSLIGTSLKALLLALLLTPEGYAQHVFQERLEVVGWNKGCSVGVAHYGYPDPSVVKMPDPIVTLIGSLSLAPGQNKPEIHWLMTRDGLYTYEAADAKNALDHLAAHDYKRPGTVEKLLVLDERQPLEDVLASTASLSAAAAEGWPPPTFKLSEIHYSPLGTCALLVYRFKESPRPYFQYLLTRIKDPSIRKVRAQAHAANSVLLFERGDSPAALAEAKLSAELAPEFPPARYRHAAMLSLSGSLDEAVEELAQALRRDKALKAKARKNPDFENLKDHPRFIELTR